MQKESKMTIEVNGTSYLISVLFDWEVDDRTSKGFYWKPSWDVGFVGEYGSIAEMTDDINTTFRNLADLESEDL
jgi:hypothetical protein